MIGMHNAIAILCVNACVNRRCIGVDKAPATRHGFNPRDAAFMTYSVRIKFCVSSSLSTIRTAILSDVHRSG